MARRWETADDTHRLRCARIGRIDDAERRGAAFDQRHRGADIFGGRDLCSDAAPDAEMRQRRLRTFARGHRIGIDRKSTRLTPVTNAHLVCRLLLEKQKTKLSYN